MGRKTKQKLGKPKRGYGVKKNLGHPRNPNAKILEQNLYRNRILPNKKKDVKPEIENDIT